MRAKFQFDGHGVKIPHDVVEALNKILDKPIEREDSAYHEGYRDEEDLDDKGEPKWKRREKDPEDAGQYLYVSTYREYEGDLERVQPLLPAGVKIIINGLGNPNPIMDMHAMLERLYHKIVGGQLSEPASYVNKRVDVHVPGVGLLAVDEVNVFENECTDRLQGYLDEGWKILAICPQPDQRRPDYILGRTRV